MWNLPGSVISLLSLALADRFLTTGPSGKSSTLPFVACDVSVTSKRPLPYSWSQRVGHDWRDLAAAECKGRKSRNTWSNRQIWPWSTEWSRAKANRVLPGEHTGHNKHPLPTTQETTLHMDITRWSIPKSECLYYLQLMMKLYTISKNKTGSWLWHRAWNPYCKMQTQVEESRENY